jgi:hypothetical protein
MSADRMTSTRQLPMTEADLERSVVDLCRQFNIKRFHPYLSVRSTSGWPDESLLGKRGLLFRELKGDKGKVTAAQREWIDALRFTGQDADVWWPDDWRSGRILRELEAIR